MDFLKAVKNSIGRNIWIPTGAVILGILPLKLSDSPVIIKILRRLLPALSYNFIENLFVAGGLTLLFGSFGMFFIWLNAYNKKRLAKRKSAMRQAAQEMNWNYDEYQKSGLSPHLDNYKQCRILGIAANSFCANLTVSNILSQTVGDDLLIVFDSKLTETSYNQDKNSFIYAETIYLIVSDNLNLPYFQTQPESRLGDTAADFLKNKAGVDNLNFPQRQRPGFSKKYILNGSDRQSIERVFTPPVFDFYEQNQLYRTIGDGKMFCHARLQTEPINQFQINSQLQILRRLYQLLKSS